ncbi:MAG: acetoacetate decarboxylase family protein [Chitinophagaceae bacterium]
MGNDTGTMIDSFFDRPQREALLSVGKTFMPCHFRKVHYIVALFKTKKIALEKILAGTELVPALRWGSQYMVALGLIRYFDSDLGAYDEVILSVPSIPLHVKTPFSNWADLAGPLANRKVGQYIFHIPVTSTFSEFAGKELWGFPKIVTPITHDFKPGSIESAVMDAEGKNIMQISGRLGFSIPSIPLSLITYSFRDGHKLRTEVKVRGVMKLYLQQSLKLEIGDSDHQMAKDLRLLELDGKKPMIVMDSDKFQSVFGEGITGWE